MIKKINFIVIVLFTIVFCGCSCNKDDLISENSKLIEENEKINEDKEKYYEIDNLFSWYNNITVNNINSFVLVESKSAFGNTLYSDGVVLGNIGLDYYILADYNKLFQNGLVTYRVMDANASVYKAKIVETNSNTSYDNETGLVLLKVNVNSYTNLVMKSIDLGEKSEVIAHVSSVEQINKIEILENIKTSTITYNDTSYEYYSFDETINNGALINSNNQLCGVFSSTINGFMSISLLKEIVYVSYSLIL